MDRIRIDGITCRARLGVSEEERRIPQQLMVDVAISLDLEAAANTDDVRLTADYRRVIEEVQGTVSQGEFQLLESLTQKICRAILSDTRIGSVQVTARKFPQSLQGKVQSVAVEMTRGR